MLHRIRRHHLTPSVSDDAEKLERLLEAVGHEVGVARGNFGVAETALHNVASRQDHLLDMAEAAGAFFSAQTKRMGLEDEVDAEAPRDEKERQACAARVLADELDGFVWPRGYYSRSGSSAATTRMVR